MTAAAGRSGRLAANVAGSLLARALTAVAALLGVRQLIGGLGTEAYGVIAFAGALLGHFSLAGLGLPGALPRFVARAHESGDRESAARYVRATMGVYLGVGAIGCAATLGIAFGGLPLIEIPEALRPDARLVLLIAAGWSLVHWPCQALGQALQGLQDFGRWNLSLVVHALVLNCCYIAIGTMKLPLPLAQAAFVAASAAAFALNFAALRRALPDVPLRPAWDTATLRELLTFSIWVLLAALSGLAVYETSNAILAFAVSAAAVGIFSIVAMPFNALREINSVALAAVMPAVAAADAARDAAFIRQVLFRGARLHIALVATGVWCGIGAAEAFLRLWVGEEIAQHAGSCRLLLGAYLWVVSLSVPAQCLIGIGAVRLLGSVAGLVALATIAGSLILAPRMGVEGVALATLLGYAVSMPAAWWYFRRLGVPLWEYSWRVLAPIHSVGATGAAAIWATAEQLERMDAAPALVLVVLAAEGAAVLLACIALGLPKEDRDLLAGLVRSRPGGR